MNKPLIKPYNDLHHGQEIDLRFDYDVKVTGEVYINFQGQPKFLPMFRPGAYNKLNLSLMICKRNVFL